MQTMQIVKHKYSRGYVLVTDRSYAAKGGGRWFGYDPARDLHAIAQPLAEIRDELDDQLISHDVPARWPRGADSIDVQTRG